MLKQFVNMCYLWPMRVSSTLQEPSPEGAQTLTRLSQPPVANLLAASAREISIRQHTHTHTQGKKKKKNERNEMKKNEI